MKVFLVVTESGLTRAQMAKANRWVGKTRGKHDFSNHVFGNRRRITIPLPASAPAKGEHEDSVHAHLSAHGYTPHDYHKGLVKDKYGREARIGKALIKTKAHPDLLKGYQNDSVRAAKSHHNDMHIVISRHPADVAGMSTNKGWSSCMNLHGGECNSHVQHDVKQGTHVAYLAKKSDRTLSNPIARVALKPFTAVSKNAKSKRTILRPEPRVYGSPTPEFHGAVKDWAHKHFPVKDKSKKTYTLHKSLYNDGVGSKIIPAGGLMGAMKKSIADHGSITFDVAKHPAFSSRHATAAMKMDVTHLGDVPEKHITRGHLNKFVNSPSRTGYDYERAARVAINHPKFSKGMLNKIASKPDLNHHAALEVITHPKASRKIVYQMHAHASQYNKRAADAALGASKYTTLSHIKNQAIGGDVQAKANTRLKGRHLQAVINSVGGHTAAFTNPNATHEMRVKGMMHHAKSVVKHTDEYEKLHHVNAVAYLADPEYRTSHNNKPIESKKLFHIIRHASKGVEQASYSTGNKLAYAAAKHLDKTHLMKVVSGKGGIHKIVAARVFNHIHVVPDAHRVHVAIAGLKHPSNDVASNAAHDLAAKTGTEHVGHLLKSKHTGANIYGLSAIWDRRDHAAAKKHVHHIRRLLKHDHPNVRMWAGQAQVLLRNKS